MSTSRQQAEFIAVKGLQYLAGDEEQLNRFLSITGCDVQSLRENAQSPEFLAGILEFFLGNESTLLAFCAEHSINPAEIQGAQYQLGGGPAAGPGEFEL